MDLYLALISQQDCSVLDDFYVGGFLDAYSPLYFKLVNASPMPNFQLGKFLTYMHDHMLQKLPIIGICRIIPRVSFQKIVNISYLRAGAGSGKRQYLKYGC